MLGDLRVQRYDHPRSERGGTMLRGRYGIGWMIVAWLAIVVVLAGGIWLVSQFPGIRN